MAIRPVALPDHLEALHVAPHDDDHVVAAQAIVTRAAPGATATLPCALPPCGPFPEGRLSPRLLVLLARAVPTRAGDDVLLVGEPLVALGALLLALPADRRPASVTLVTKAGARAEWTLGKLQGGDGVLPFEVLAGPLQGDHIALPPGFDPERRFAHVLCVDAGWSRAEAAALLGPDGTATVAETDTRRPRIVQWVQSGGVGADIDLGGHRIATPLGDAGPDRGRHPTGVPVSRLLAVERMQRHTWRGVASSRVEQAVLRAVRETVGAWDDGPNPTGDRLATRLFHLGYLEQVAGTRVGAEALYRASLHVAESPEAWTFYGWVRAQGGDLEGAIDSCRRAIEIDPTFGNPYNDIGAYQLAKGDPSGAKTWFHRATQAPRYAAPHYPYTNLGRVFLREGDLDAAREAIEHALEMMPGYAPAERLLREIEARERNDPRSR